GHYKAIAVGVDEVRVDPVAARVGELPDIELTRCQQHLAELAIDLVAVDVCVLECVVLTESLDLGDGVMKRTPVPEANVIKSRFVFRDIDTGFQLCRVLLFGDPSFDTERGTGGRNVAGDVRGFNRDFVLSDVHYGADSGGDRAHEG